jgi:mannose-6-phosphate isomerase-like protein (cupin superfamily)
MQWKHAFQLITTLGIALALNAQTPLPATDVTAAQIQDFLKALPRDAVSDKAIRTIDVGGYRVGVFGVFRPKSAVQEAILHETKVTEIYYMLDGAATLVTGGTIPNSRRSAPAIGHPSQRGPKIEGGVSRRVTKGDVIIIPGGTPHWFSAMESDLTYLIYRPDPEGTLPLK